MHGQERGWGRRLGLFAVGVGTIVLAGTPTTAAGDPPQSVPDWISHHAVALDHVDPAGPDDDLMPLRRSIGEAQIVGLGESTHGAAEELTLKHRLVRLLVEQLGFRSIAFEDQWTTGLRVDEYIRTGTGDLDTITNQLGGQWQTQEVADLLRWLRDFNTGRADKVQFVGVEYYSTGPSAYDVVYSYVAGAAPEKLAELRGHLHAIRPATPNMSDHVSWYQGVPDKRPYLEHARRVHDLIADVPHHPGARAHELALQHARQIVSFYEHYTLSLAEGLVYRDAQAAQNLRWWREFTGDKIAYWAASAHTANATQLRIAVPPGPDFRFPSVGSYLRQWYGQQYLSIGFTFDHGAVSLGPGKTVAMPQPASDWFEQPFGKVHLDQFVLDLRRPAPTPVRRWLAAPVKTRGLAHGGPDSFMDGGSLGQWFDVIVHRQEVRPAVPI
ncbi:erythromycin esterase family protein [Nocardia brasiliensis]|uniref:erythromycin esterase family protein n=1 Tax=Nocardia brasiliensis TaxID=37326 RepID=UPI003670E491